MNARAVRRQEGNAFQGCCTTLLRLSVSLHASQMKIGISWTWGAPGIVQFIPWGLHAV